jgi:N-dimethylarginine dimethylaminohydrolase
LTCGRWIFASLLLISIGYAAPYGGQSMVWPLRKVLVRAPDASFVVENPTLWHYAAKPNLADAIVEHKDFVKILKDHGVEIIYHKEKMEGLADAIFVHDPAIITDHGAIILKMGKNLRSGEEAGLKNHFMKAGIPILAELSGQATAEGGDCLWLDPKTLLIGRGYRTNDEGIQQIHQAVKPHGIKVIAFDLPFDQGKEACLHLQSLISLVDEKMAVVFRKLMPVALIQLLEDRGFTLIDVPEDEYQSMATNILAIAPKVCLTLEGNHKTKAKLEQAGVKVFTYRGNEISLKAEGGATCLTRPILRKPFPGT